MCVFLGGLGVESSVALLIHRYTFTNWSESSDSCRNLNWFFLNFTKIRSWKHIFFSQYTSTNIRDTQYLLIISDAVSDAWLTLFDYFFQFQLIFIFEIFYFKNFSCRLFFDQRRTTLNRQWLSTYCHECWRLQQNDNCFLCCCCAWWLLHVSRELIIEILQTKLKLLKSWPLEYRDCPTIGHDRESDEGEREMLN